MYWKHYIKHLLNATSSMLDGDKAIKKDYKQNWYVQCDIWARDCVYKNKQGPVSNNAHLSARGQVNIERKTTAKYKCKQLKVIMNWKRKYTINIKNIVLLLY